MPPKAAKSAKKEAGAAAKASARRAAVKSGAQDNEADDDGSQEAPAGLGTGFDEDDEDDTNWMVGLQFWIPGDPEATTKAERGLQQVGPQQMLTVNKTDEVEDVLDRMNRDAVKALGGELAAWRITLQADGASAGLFKAATLLKLEDESGPYPQGISDETRTLWRKYKAALGRCLSGTVRVTRDKPLQDSSVKTEKKKGKEIPAAVNKKEIKPLPHVTEGVVKADKNILEATICNDPHCAHRARGNRSCWVPSWNPEFHMPLDDDGDARFVWAAALDNKKDPKVSTTSPPMCPPFIRPELGDGKAKQPAASSSSEPSRAASTSQAKLKRTKPVTISLLSDDSDDDAKIKEVNARAARSKSRATGNVKMDKDGKKAKQSGPPATPPSVKREPLEPVDNNAQAANLAGQRRLYGTPMTLDAFCIEYGIPDDVKEKLIAYRALTAHTLALLTADQLVDAGLVKAEPQLVWSALDMWCDNVPGSSAKKARHSSPGAAAAATAAAGAASAKAAAAPFATTSAAQLDGNGAAAPSPPASDALLLPIPLLLGHQSSLDHYHSITLHPSLSITTPTSIAASF
ncbi:hypothetical protein OC835_007416 [Tilletia horrida]|nr:hypothetical protein OC835_007416 [Tilletia horrida]